MRPFGMIYILLAAVFVSACTAPPKQQAPFSEDWRRNQRAVQEMERRQEYIRGGEKEDSALKVDEQGRPRLGLGGESGLSADIDYDSGPSAEVKYKMRWNFVKPQHRGGGSRP